MRTWPDIHDAALKKFHEQSMSFAQIAAAINSEFSTTYSRNAVLGRANRLGLRSLCTKARGPSMRKKRANAAAQVVVFTPKPKAPLATEREQLKLRCAEVAPLRRQIFDLEPGQCRWPYGEGPFEFCAHPATEGSNYCMPHFCLSLGPGTEAERAADRVSRRTT